MILNADKFFVQNPSGFMVIEGLNGAGKSTLQNRLANYLAGKKYNVVETREPGGTALGTGLRRLLLDQNQTAPNRLTEMLLFAADRAEHVAHVIKPALQVGKLVISDRYYYSSIAFQSFGRGLDYRQVEEVNHIAIAGAFPDFVLLLDIEPQAGLLRVRDRSVSNSDRFESEELEFQYRIRNGFLALAQRCSEPFIVLDASQSADAIFEQACTVIDIWLQLLGAR